MPFTPFHMGPGFAVKALCGRHFSLTVFGFSQIMMDIEPLVRIIRGGAVLHGFTHTYLGATLIALVSLFLGRPICQRLLDYFIPDPNSPFLRWLRGPKTITWPAAIAGAVAGAYSHVVLDSIMHADMLPFGPVSGANPLLHVISVNSLHLLCTGSGVAGALILLVLYFWRART
ncbi:MAG: Protein of unknown function transrane [Polaromonas sp.]|nr:Protein of unknown function transrane [Polaromonas sp.]